MRRIGFYLLIITVFLLAPLLALPQKAVPAPAAAPTPTPTAAARAAAPDRAVWVSYLEWEQVDFSSAEAFTQAIGTMLDNIQSIGATVVLAQVRPFGDALYPSDYFPFSHLCTGTQGQDPGFDPLALLVDAAHARDLQLEAWVNPYRIQAGQTPALCGASPARLHPDWVRYTDTGAYLDPASADVRQYIADGVGELCARNAVDGIHIDDYYYPTPPARTCGSTLPSVWGSCAQATRWTASTLTTIFTPPPTRPLTRRTTRPAAAHGRRTTGGGRT